MLLAMAGEIGSSSWENVDGQQQAYGARMGGLGGLGNMGMLELTQSHMWGLSGIEVFRRRFTAVLKNPTTSRLPVRVTTYLCLAKSLSYPLNPRGEVLAMI